MLAETMTTWWRFFSSSKWLCNRCDVLDDRALLTTRVRTMYGFDELAAAIDAKAKETAAFDKLRYVM